MNDVDKNESPSIYMLKEAAKRNNIYLVGGIENVLEFLL